MPVLMIICISGAWRGAGNTLSDRSEDIFMLVFVKMWLKLAVPWRSSPNPRWMDKSLEEEMTLQGRR
jgi:hypothetical protein